MKKFGFYIMGKRGFCCLTRFVEEYGCQRVAYVTAAPDDGVQKDYFNEISQFCGEQGITLLSRSDENTIESDFQFAIGWRWMITKSDGLIVFHDSLLPKYRGFAPLVNMLINGEDKVGVTALFASSSYDAGDIIDQKSEKIAYPIKISEAIDRVATLYEKLLVSVVDKALSDDDFESAPQDKSLATYSLWRDENDYEIDWQTSSESIRRFVDAVGYPFAGAKTLLNGEWIRVLDVEPIDDVLVENRASHIGKIIFMNHGEPVVVCAEGLLRLKELIDKHGNSLIGKVPFRTRFGV